MDPFQNDTISTTPPPVLFGLETVGVAGLGTVELNRPKILNALNTECYKLLEERLHEWQDDPAVGAILISGKGGKAFCAGGDVKGLIMKSKELGPNIAREFFTREYFVDAFIHKYKKTVIAVCDGITMGGGLGLAAGAFLRVATEKTLAAMPELSIGLYPDVGATRFLQNLRPPFGLFMGLTGARLSGADVVQIGLMDAFVPSNRLRHLHADLLRCLSQTTDREALKSTVMKHSALVTNEAVQQYANIKPQDERTIEDIFSRKSLLEIHERFKSAKKLSPWLEETRQRYLSGSPLSRAVFFAAWQRHRDLSITEALVREWAMSVHFSTAQNAAGQEFAEGVRAVLIDKDQAPKWKYADLDQVPEAEIEACFHSDSENLLAKKFREFNL